MRAQHIVDVLGDKTGGGETGEIRPILPVIAQLVWPLLVIARAGVDQDGRPRRLYDCAVKREDHETAGRFHQRRLEPGSVPRNDFRRRPGMNHCRLEQRSLELKHTGDFDLAHAPAVNRAACRRHRALLLYSPAAVNRRREAYPRRPGNTKAGRGLGPAAEMSALAAQGRFTGCWRAALTR